LTNKGQQKKKKKKKKKKIQPNVDNIFHLSGMSLKATSFLNIPARDKSK
jgi:hypothetical protein